MVVSRFTENKPDFGIMGSYSSMWTDPEHRWMVGVSVNLPVWRKRIEAAAAEAKARVAQAESEREHLVIEIQADVREKLVRVAEARQAVQRGLGRGRATEAGDRRAELTQPQGEPAALEAGVPRDEHPPAGPEVRHLRELMSRGRP